MVLQANPEELPHPRRQILCNIPLDISVDELVIQRELVGDGRLAKALEGCEKKGWEARFRSPPKS